MVQTVGCIIHHSSNMNDQSQSSHEQTLTAVWAALQAGDRDLARRLLSPLLKNPTAEAWYLAAHLVDEPEQAIMCLRRALALDPWHGAANRMLSKLEGDQPGKASEVIIEQDSRQKKTAFVTPTPPPQPATATTEVATTDQSAETAPETDESGRGQRRRKNVPTNLERTGRRRRRWGRIALIFSVFAMLPCSVIALTGVGLMSGVLTRYVILTGGPTPVYEIDSVPIEDIDDAPLLIPPSRNLPPPPGGAEVQDATVLEAGYTHQYEFNARSGQVLAVYVQFLSVAAQNVPRNVVIFDPDGIEASGICERDAILQDGTNIIYICPIDKSGTWSVRILGRSEESVGAYFVAVRELE